MIMMMEVWIHFSLLKKKNDGNSLNVTSRLLIINGVK